MTLTCAKQALLPDLTVTCLPKAATVCDQKFRPQKITVPKDKPHQLLFRKYFHYKTVFKYLEHSERLTKGKKERKGEAGKKIKKKQAILGQNIFK